MKGLNNRSAFCECHNGRVSYNDLTSTYAPFFTVDFPAEFSTLYNSKLKMQESPHFAPDETLCNLCSTPCGVMCVTKATYKNVLKPQGSRLYKQSGHILHAFVI